MRFFRNDLNIDFMGARKWAILGSLLIIGVGIASLIVKNGPRYGVDFAGGTLVQVKFNVPMEIDTLRNTLKGLDMGEILIQRYGEKEENEVLLRMSATTSSLEGFETRIGDALTQTIGADAFEIRRVEMVGPKVGKDLREKGIWAIIFATLGVLIYTWWRFEFVYALGAIIALIHDVLVTVGAFSLTNREFTLPVIAALLTIIGYSLNDTIVVFDRVRDNLKLMRNRSLKDILNTSINQTLGRTVLTSLTTFFVVFCLYVLGGEVINDFAFALIIGVIVGTYSSVYIASPVALFFHNLAPSAKGAGGARAKREMGPGMPASSIGPVNKGGVSRMMEQQKQIQAAASSESKKKGSKGSSKRRKKNRRG
ncbi:MAG: protein translocase subunit SecF [bacterium]